MLLENVPFWKVILYLEKGSILAGNTRQAQIQEFSSGGPTFRIFLTSKKKEERKQRV